MKTSLKRVRIGFLALMASLGWMPPLLMRLFVGYFFFETGWAKLHNLDAFAERFAGWGIPYPAFNASLSAYTECIGGALIVVGLLTRLASIPLIINIRRYNSAVGRLEVRHHSTSSFPELTLRANSRR